jgi:hypothetical protein
MRGVRLRFTFWFLTQSVQRPFVMGGYRVFVEWGPIALKKYRLAEVGTEFPVGVKKMADGHVRIIYHRSLSDDVK